MQLAIVMVKHLLSGIGILIIVLALLACPAQAFTAKNLDINIYENTDAIITFSYDLSWYENAAVFSKIGDPATELAKAFREQFKKNVEIISVSGNKVQLRVDNFAYLRVNQNGMFLITPTLSFKNAEKALNRYWFASLITPDFSPEVTRVSFPDGYYEEFYNQDQIPSIRHMV